MVFTGGDDRAQGKAKVIRELNELAGSDFYPFHMPGHKRNMAGWPMSGAYGYDITEIDGFDDLQDAKGIIRALELRAISYMGSDDAHILVNGSTSGILAAISAAVPHRGKLLMARNSHQSAFNAAFLGELQCSYIQPQIIPDYGLCGGIGPEQVAQALDEDDEIQAVYVTSPTYEGMLSDIGSIADIVHSHGLPLIVDSAHGAHLKAENSADIIIMSLHKTLPAFTSSALCLVNGDIINREQLHEYINIFQTSSPSYLLMSGIENCFDILEKEGPARFERLHANINKLREAAKGLKNICLPGPDYAGSYAVAAFDHTKIIIADRSGRLNGRQIYDRLREVHHLQPEMAEGMICLAMTSVMDTDGGFERLVKALEETDDYIRSKDG